LSLAGEDIALFKEHNNRVNLTHAILNWVSELILTSFESIIFLLYVIMDSDFGFLNRLGFANFQNRLLQTILNQRKIITCLCRSYRVVCKSQVNNTGSRNVIFIHKGGD